MHHRLLAGPLVCVEPGGRSVYLALCGFGLAAAGAGAAWAMAEVTRTRALQRVYLAGIAGTYRPRRLPVGGVIAGTFARGLGIGAGTGHRHLSAEAMGWAQGLPRANLPPVGDSVPLCLPRSPEREQVVERSGGRAAGAQPTIVAGGLLSVAAASGSRFEAARRARAHPDALAEEMEAFAVALAARLAGVPLTVIRGIANLAGERETTRWRTAEALAAARRVLEQLLTTDH